MKHFKMTRPLFAEEESTGLRKTQPARDRFDDRGQVRRELHRTPPVRVKNMILRNLIIEWDADEISFLSYETDKYYCRTYGALRVFYGDKKDLLNFSFAAESIEYYRI